MQNTKVVFSKELANKLVNAGFELIKTEINIKDPKYRVFIFKNTPELEAMVANYKVK
jgi:hypothetical protein